MRKKLQKVGASRGVIIPGQVLDLLNWQDDTIIDFIVDTDRLILKAAENRIETDEENEND